MKGSIKKIVALICVLATLMSTSVFAIKTEQDENQRIFNVSATDVNGYAIINADVYLYSFTEDQIVSSGMTDETGKCVLNYMPKLDDSTESIVDQDFLICVQKEGYESGFCDLTKLYSKDLYNDTQYPVVMDITNPSVLCSESQVLSAEAMQYLSAKGAQPFYVIRGRELEQIDELIPNNSNSTRGSTFWNENIPIGIFHVNKNSSLGVTFASTDSVTVQSGIKRDTGVCSISGSRTKTFGSLTEFNPFTTTLSTPQQKTYYTGGYFERYLTAEGTTGRIVEHYVLDSILGGAITSSTSNCYVCGADFDKASTEYGRCIPIERGATVTISDFKGKSFDFGLNINLKKYQVTVPLNVVTNTTMNTALKYSTVGNYALRVYDNNSGRKLWHVTSRSA